VVDLPDLTPRSRAQTLEAEGENEQYLVRFDLRTREATYMGKATDFEQTA